MRVRMTLSAVLSGVLALQAGCVTKGTHNRIVGDLESERGALEESLEEALQQERDLREAAEAEAQERAAQEAELRAEISRLQVEVDRVDIQRIQALTEVERLGEALGERGAANRDLQQRLQRLSAVEQEIRDRNRIYEEVIGRFQSLIDGGQMTVGIVRGRLVMQLPQDVLFESGSATLGREGRETLAQLATALSDFADRTFQVEGHTDNVPIATARFASNWDLSTARALSVVALLVEQGVDPAALSAAGYGEFQPVASNEDRDSRRLNRRIEIVLVPNLDVIAQGVPG